MRLTIVKSGSDGHWHQLIKDAQDLSGTYIEDNMQNYLVFTLDRYIDFSSLGSNLYGLEYLKTKNLSKRLKINRLQQLGDECLLISGLFPELVDKKNVSLDYIMTLGQQAYYRIANIDDSSNLLFLQLGDQFSQLTDILANLRKLRIYLI